MKATFKIIMKHDIRMIITADGCDSILSEEIKYYHFYIRNKGTKEYIALIPKEHIKSLTLEL